MKAGTCAARVSEPRQVRKEAAVRRKPGGAVVIRAGAGSIGSAGSTVIDEGVRGHLLNLPMTPYQTLYRKYRSQTFADLVGQDATSRALQGAIASDRVAHAYLFAGTRGTGKTSSARLLAKAINCSGRAASSSEPCNACDSCVQVAAGAALDLIEIDAASNRGIDEIRDLREKVKLAPALGKRKVYIIDEAHMLTPDAFNALLKTLEEPPEHVVFILCTTEAQKVPLTVVGRCQQFTFRRLSEEQIGSRLSHIARLEGVTVEPGALALIARTAQGSMRDAVGLLDQLVPLAEGPVTLEGARSVLGISDPALVSGLLDLVLAGEAAAALGQLASIYEAGGELRQVVRGLMERGLELLVESISAHDEGRRARLSSLLDALLHLDGEVRRHAEPRFLVEATLVRLAVEGTLPAAAVAAVPTMAAAPVLAPAPSLPEAVRPPAPSPPEAVRSPAPSLPEAVRPPAPSVDPAVPDPPRTPLLAASGSTDGWRVILEELKPTVRGYFRVARPELIGTVLVLWFPYAFHHQKAQEHSELITPLVQGWLGAGSRVDFKLQEGPSPAGQNVVEVAAPRPLAPEEDPGVQAAVRKLEGKVIRVREIR